MKIKDILERHWRSYQFHENLNESERRDFDGNEEIEILFDKELEYNERYGHYERLIIFRNSKGQLGYQHYEPAGWSTHTYDPDVETHVYNTTDLQWFLKYALTEDLRDHCGRLEGK